MARASTLTREPILPVPQLLGKIQVPALCCNRVPCPNDHHPIRIIALRIRKSRHYGQTSYLYLLQRSSRILSINKHLSCWLCHGHYVSKAPESCRGRWTLDVVKAIVATYGDSWFFLARRLTSFVLVVSSLSRSRASWCSGILVTKTWYSEAREAMAKATHLGNCSNFKSSSSWHPLLCREEDTAAAWYHPFFFNQLSTTITLPQWIHASSTFGERRWVQPRHNSLNTSKTAHA